MDTPDISALISDLNERTKELNCLYKLDEILKDFDRNLPDIFLDIIEVLPTGWRYSEICKVQISFNEQIWQSEGYKRTELRQYAKIKSDDRILGEIQIVYIRPIRHEKGIFLPEEIQLLQTIAEKIGHYLAYRSLREKFEETKQEKTGSKDTDKLFSNWLKGLFLTDEQIQRLTKVKISFKKGETICKQGSFASYTMILKEGLVKACIESSHERNCIFKITKPYNFIGLSALQGDNYYHFSANAIVPSTLYLVEKSNFNNLINENTKFATRIIRAYCASFEHIYSRVSCLANKQALGRVADVLLYLSGEVFEKNIIENVVTRKDIAELAGMSTENAVRILSEFRKDGLIRIHTKGIEVVNPNILNTLSISG
ncbi:MAG: Crp/Fnr family transcriptional regulator [Bacteroidota bacterium]